MTALETYVFVHMFVIFFYHKTLITFHIWRQIFRKNVQLFWQFILLL